MRKRLFALGVCAAALTLATLPAGAGDGPGFKTSEPAYLKGVGGTTVMPIISVGDTVGGYMFEAIPDGISFSKINGNGTADILVNHELSLVPFPATRQDPSNSLVSEIRLHQKSAGVLKGSYVIPSSAGYQRFCSNFVVGEEHGFERDLLLTNEEARDIVLRQEDSWHQPGVQLSEPGAEQAGVVVAYDIKSGAYRSIYGMGRHNHENDVGVPGYGYPVVFSGDDTFDAPASQLYLYKAASGAAVWNDQGALYAFVSDNPAVNDYGDLSTASPTVTGHFIEVPRAIATGKINGREVTSADFGYPTPAAANPPTPAMPDGPQWVLEHWSNLNNVFQFIRIEDLAYDRTNGKVLYFADTGEPRAIPDATTTRLRRGGGTTRGPYMNGRLYRLALNSSDPLGTATLSILPGANFDDLGYNNAAAPHQPDNIESTKNAIFFQEDAGSHNAQPANPAATNARIWRYDLTTGISTVVAEVDQSMSPVVNRGTWESSGIVDASAVFGPGAFLVDVQAHQWDMDAGTGNDAPAVPKRERGQLLLIKVANP
jgi:glycerophosphoryl diester phosphodiesterase